MKQTHKEAIYLNWSSKRTRARLAAPLFSSRWTSERQQVLRSVRAAPTAGLKGKRGVLQRTGAPARTFAALSQRESHLPGADQTTALGWTPEIKPGDGRFQAWAAAEKLSRGRKSCQV